VKHIGAYEAKTHLPRLLEEVSKGKEIVITKHGVPVAILRPYDDRKKYASKATINKLKQFRKDKRLDGLNLKAIIEAGRD
jgi:prevent-host-death family protein